MTDRSHSDLLHGLEGDVVAAPAEVGVQALNFVQAPENTNVLKNAA